MQPLKVSLSLSPVCIPWLFQRLLPFPNNMSGCGPVWTVTTSQKEKTTTTTTATSCQILTQAPLSLVLCVTPSPGQDGTMGHFILLFGSWVRGGGVGQRVRKREEEERRSRGGAEEALETKHFSVHSESSPTNTNSAAAENTDWFCQVTKRVLYAVYRSSFYSSINGFIRATVEAATSGVYCCSV